MVDARGLSCPQPVIMVADALKSGDNSYTVMVDGVTPKENVTRYAMNNGYKVECKDTAEGDYELILTKQCQLFKTLHAIIAMFVLLCT